MDTLKRFIAICLCLCLLIPIAGCGNKDSAAGAGGGTGGTSGGDFVYTAEFKQLEGDAPGSVCVRGSSMYYVEWSYDEAAETSTSILKRMDLNTLSVESLPVGPLSENVSCLQALEDGSLLLLLSVWDDASQNQSHFLVKTDASGAETMRQDVTALLSEGSGTDMVMGYPQSMQVDASGNIYILVSGMDEKVVVLDSQGGSLFELTNPSWSHAMCRSGDGRVFLLSYGNGGEQGGYMLQYIDPQSKSFGESLNGIPDGSGGMYWAEAGEKELLISSGNSLYRYNLEDKTCEPLLNWLNCDVNPDTIQGLAVLEDGRILALTYDYEQSEHPLEAVFLSRTPASEVKQKTVLTFATMYLDYTVRSQLIRFNKENDTWRIEVREYGNGDYEDGLAQLNSDIVSGNPPDLIDLSNINAENYIAKGILTDLYPLMDQDSTMAREDFAEGALRIYESGGKLYALCPSFGVITLAGKKEDVGGREGWTIEDIRELLASKPAGTELIEYASRETILSMLAGMSLDNYADWENGSCSFDSEDFISLLEFAGQFPAAESLDYNDTEGTYAKLKEGKLLLQGLGVYSVSDYLYMDAMFEGQMSCVGYPTSDGSTGSYLQSMQAIGIAEKSGHKDGAWAFLSSLLSEEHQDNLSMSGLPLRSSSLEKQLAKAMEQSEAGAAAIMSGDFTYEVKAATKEQIDALRQLLATASPQKNSDSEIMNIISEEAAPFFAGQKTAKEAADIIQSRVQIYISENQ